MGDREKASLRLQFNPQIRLELHGATITSDAGLLPIRELDDALGLTHIAADYLQESRTGRNIRHHLVPLLRQSIYSRLAGYDDTNDAERLSQDPAMRVVGVSSWHPGVAGVFDAKLDRHSKVLGQGAVAGQLLLVVRTVLAGQGKKIKGVFTQDILQLDPGRIQGADTPTTISPCLMRCFNVPIPGIRKPPHILT